MKLFKKNLEKEILYIAEIGVNHEGSMSRCMKLIKEAKSAGADVVKFQCFTPEKYISTSERPLVEMHFHKWKYISTSGNTFPQVNVHLWKYISTSGNTFPQVEIHFNK